MRRIPGIAREHCSRLAVTSSYRGMICFGQQTPPHCTAPPTQSSLKRWPHIERSFKMCSLSITKYVRSKYLLFAKLFLVSNVIALSKNVGKFTGSFGLLIPLFPVLREGEQLCWWLFRLIVPFVWRVGEDILMRAQLWQESFIFCLNTGNRDK